MSVALSSTGAKMPLVGFGLWKVTNATCADTVYNAIKGTTGAAQELGSQCIEAGYRLLDGAGDYANECEAGEGVRRAIADGLVKREELFITSKLWNTFHAKEHVKPVSQLQLKHWGIDYFDLFLVHFPVALKYVDPAERYPPMWWAADMKTVTLQDTPMQETWTAMEELVDAGIAKNIGISNCQGSIIGDILRYARIKPAVLQVELHPYLTQEALVNYAKLVGIQVTAYSSFGPQSYVELGVDTGKTSLLSTSHEVIGPLAAKYKKTTAQVLLRWSTQRGIAVIPKSNNAERLAENLDCLSFDLSDDEIKAISKLNINLRMNDPVEIDPHVAIFA